MKKENKIILILVLVLLLIIGGTYAYFSINATSDNTGAKVTGKAGSLGNPTLKINTSKLYLNLDANLMSEANAGKTYYANEDESGVALTTNPNYILATVQLTDGDQPLDCEYNYKVTATIAKEITDGSDSDILVAIGDKSLSLKEILDATDGIIVSGKIKNLTNGNDQTISLSSTAKNTENKQDNLVGNLYTIIIEPYNSGDAKAFSCKVHKNIFAEELIASGNLWQSGLEGDGYRYVGSGAVGTGTNPNNFICFGTSDMSECTTNQDKYMYRIIGVFADSNGNNHIKLIKYKQLGLYAWNANRITDISWENSDMYKGLNGNYFLTNTTYIPNDTWSNRIENWTWSAVNTQTYNNGGPQYYSITTEQIYLHEMNRNSKAIAVGSWTMPSAKIGLMYASDYALSLGEKILLAIGSSDFATLKTGWMHHDNNDKTKSTEEWTISRYGNYVRKNVGEYYFAWSLAEDGLIYSQEVSSSSAIRPVFYLTTDVVYSSGTGSIDDPFMIE